MLLVLPLLNQLFNFLLTSKKRIVLIQSPMLETKLSYYRVMSRNPVEGETNRRLNPIPTGQGRNQSLYERHVTKSGQNRKLLYSFKRRNAGVTKNDMMDPFASIIGLGRKKAQ